MSELSLDLTSELEAVNSILASVGESPIASFDEVFADSGLAATLLASEMRATQNIGWTWNTDLAVTFTPDDDGYIYLSPRTLKATFTDKDIVRRGLRLYHRTDHTYTFTDEIEVPEVVTLLEWDDTPEDFRRFITIRAGRKFQDRLGTDQVLHKFHERDELAAWAALQNNEGEVAGWNVVAQSALVQRMKGNR